MADFRDLETRLRHKYNFPDDVSTRGTPTETIQLGRLSFDLKKNQFKAAALQLDHPISKNPRLKNLVALLYKACEIENGRGFLRLSDKQLACIATAIFSTRNVFATEKKAEQLIMHVCTILPAISDEELARIMVEQQRRREDAVRLDKEVRKYFKRHGTVLADEETLSRASKKMRPT